MGCHSLNLFVARCGVLGAILLVPGRLAAWKVAIKVWFFGFGCDCHGEEQGLPVVGRTRPGWGLSWDLTLGFGAVRDAVALRSGRRFAGNHPWLGRVPVIPGLIRRGGETS